MSSTYRIPDEPLGGTASGFVIDPFWALLSIMFGGVWLAAPLFAINACFLRGPTWRREVLLALALVVGGAAVLLGVLGLAQSGWIPREAFKYAMLGLVVWKIGVAYWIFFLQQGSFALFEYFGGAARNGAFVILGLFLRRPVLEAIGDPFWQRVLDF